MFRKMSALAKNSNKKPTSLRTEELVKKPEHEDTKNETVSKEALLTAKRELYKFKMPISEKGLEELILSHPAGTRFQYAALTGKAEETFSARIKKLISFKSPLGKSSMKEIKIYNVKLIDDNEQFNLKQLLPKGCKEYIRISSITGYYVPLVSSSSCFTTIKVSLHDLRLRDEDHVVQSVEFNSNVENKFELSADYCFPKSSSIKMILSLSRESNFMEAGEQWAAAYFTVSLEESDFPYTCNHKEVATVMAMPESLLSDHKFNPNHVNTVMLEKERLLLRDLYEEGDVSNVAHAIEAELAPATYAPTSKGPTVKGPTEKILDREGWEGMKIRRPLEENASMEPTEDGEIVPEPVPEKYRAKGKAETSGSKSGVTFRINSPKYTELDI